MALSICLSPEMNGSKLHRGHLEIIGNPLFLLKIFIICGAMSARGNERVQCTRRTRSADQYPSHLFARQRMNELCLLHTTRSLGNSSSLFTRMPHEQRYRWRRADVLLLEVMGHSKLCDDTFCTSLPRDF